MLDWVCRYFAGCCATPTIEAAIGAFPISDTELTMGKWCCRVQLCILHERAWPTGQTASAPYEGLTQAHHPSASIQSTAPIAIPRYCHLIITQKSSRYLLSPPMCKPAIRRRQNSWAEGMLENDKANRPFLLTHDRKFAPALLTTTASTACHPIASYFIVVGVTEGYLTVVFPL